MAYPPAMPEDGAVMIRLTAPRSIRRSAAAIVLFVGLAAVWGCSNRSDPAAVDAAETLVPQGSEVTELVQNTTGISPESGPYFVRLEISDGGLGPELEVAIAEQAQQAGWESTYRSDGVGAVELGFARDNLEAVVYVFLDSDPVKGVIRVSRSD